MRRNFDPARRPQIEAALFQLRLEGRSLEQIARIEGFPTRPTLRKWLRENPALADEVAHGRNEWRKGRGAAPRHPFDPEAAERLIARVEGGDPICRLIREPGLPHRRALTAWKLARPEFAAALAAAKAVADRRRRRHRPRRATIPYSDALSDRIILALVRGATLPELYADRTLPSRKGFRRLRAEHPEFDGAVKLVLSAAPRRHGQARADAVFDPALAERIEHRLADGASLAGLAAEPGMPSRTTLYKWVRERPGFAAAVARACDFRSWMLADQAAGLLASDLPDAETRANALYKRLGQLNPYPGERPRKRKARE